ncbi:hypothetical protein FGO68_gene17408 [Halteria grandinella]|uniref:Uncharacterized protein n=1 Tax=Halteria grandinella TaxID=5974 RepID=A0A8J8NNJ2_HALGN|nr:hypothetical protein FGO68_gene17408 [Halteria grandinella]
MSDQKEEYDWESDIQPPQIPLCPVCEAHVINVTCYGPCCKASVFPQQFCHPCLIKHLKRPPRELNSNGIYRLAVREAGLIIVEKWRDLRKQPEQASQQNQSANSTQRSAVVSQSRESLLISKPRDSVKIEVPPSFFDHSLQYYPDALQESVHFSSSSSSNQNEEVKQGERKEDIEVLKDMSSFKDNLLEGSKQSISQEKLAVVVNDQLRDQGIFSHIAWKNEEIIQSSQTASAVPQQVTEVARQLEALDNNNTQDGDQIKEEAISSSLESGLDQVHEALQRMPETSSSLFDSQKEEVKQGEQYSSILQELRSSKQSNSQRRRDNDAFLSLMKGKNGIQMKEKANQRSTQHKDRNIQELQAHKQFPNQSMIDSISNSKNKANGNKENENNSCNTVEQSANSSLDSRMHVFDENKIAEDSQN